MIEFMSQGVAEPKIHKAIVRAWITAVADLHGKSVGNLCYMFCDDEHILEANRQFLQHDYYTDIITFDESQGKRISGDMLISLDTVRTNAEGLGISFPEELHRVMIHGVLHLSGYGDKSEEDEKRMRQLEDEALAILKKLLGNKALLK